MAQLQAHRALVAISGLGEQLMPPVTQEGDVSPELKRISQLFLPDLVEGMDRYQNENCRFVHYTTAEAAMKIFDSEQVWLRNAITMNDFSEIEHGKSCLLPAWDDEHLGGRLKVFLEEVFPGLVNDLAATFNTWLPHLEQDTYLTSLSEHDLSEIDYGRLSMWRAYGGRNGVALVLNSTPFMAETDVLRAYTAPVAYRSKEDFAAYFARITDGLVEARNEVEQLGREISLNSLFMFLRNTLLCTKHPGFREEREWRVIYSPTVLRSQAITADFATIGGVPQQIYKIPLLDRPELGLHGADLNNLIERVIVGPTTQPLTIWKALVAKLEALGVQDAIDRVQVSSIPLRT